MLSVLFNPRMLVTLLMAFSSGIPLALTSSTLQAWMTEEKIDIGTMGIFSLIALPYSLKFLWAPLIDRYVPPLLGRRTGWILIAQLMLALSIAAMGFIPPSAMVSYWPLALVPLLVAFFSASQDIVVDAYRADLLTPKERGFGSALYVTGYRIAMLVSGGVTLILADHMPWKSVYLIMSATMIVGILASIFAPEPAQSVATPKTLKDAVALPFIDFFTRKGAYEILVFVLLYKMDVVMTVAFTTKFMMDLGFSKTEIGIVFKFFGLFATLGGTLLGGAAMVRLGLKKSLWLFGITQGAAGLTFMWLATQGMQKSINLFEIIKNFSGLTFSFLEELGTIDPLMVSSIAIENFCSGMGNAAYSAFLLSLCSKKFSATQFALLTSLMAASRTIIQTPSGYIQAAVGWPMYYLIATLIAIPSLLMLLRYDRWHKLDEE
ncbi:MAG TPA: AmpG family muropeptide MFS transporter [Bacteriovoracaceae bacterium]|nr:AmpG family muropeptide MFS transporter [Bacteriovoracaceae bacterium]